MREGEDDVVHPQATAEEGSRGLSQYSDGDLCGDSTATQGCLASGSSKVEGSTHLPHSAALKAVLRPTAPNLYSVQTSSVKPARASKEVGMMDASD